MAGSALPTRTARDDWLRLSSGRGTDPRCTGSESNRVCARRTPAGADRIDDGGGLGPTSVPAMVSHHSKKSDVSATRTATLPEPDGASLRSRDSHARQSSTADTIAMAWRVTRGEP